MTVKRYKVTDYGYEGLGIDPDVGDCPYGVDWDGVEIVLASDYDAMDSAATALGTHVQFLECRIRELEAALKESLKDAPD
jgi:hypothetical protein